MRDPTDLPAPIRARLAGRAVDLQTVELVGQLDDKSTYDFWTFNGKVPGPFLRVRVGDTVEVNLKNADESVMYHSVDFHAATGPGGGADATQTDPGQEKTVTFKALVPGLFVYHCATPSVAASHHQRHVRPDPGRAGRRAAQVDREFYVMQGELYTAGASVSTVSQEFRVDKLISRAARIFCLQRLRGCPDQARIRCSAHVGETVRIFFGVGGPNFTSSFHVIGEIFDRVYEGASLGPSPLTGVQTDSVPPGSDRGGFQDRAGRDATRWSTTRYRGSREVLSAL